jgi:hypothetical protein
MHIKEPADEYTNSLTTFNARITLIIYPVNDLFWKYVDYSCHHLDYRVNYFDKKNANKADACKETVPHLMSSLHWLP